MSDNDLIRRGDALSIVRSITTGNYDPKGWLQSIAALPAVKEEISNRRAYQVGVAVGKSQALPAVTASDVAGLVEAAEEVLRISHREHQAWHRLRAEITKIKETGK